MKRWLGAVLAALLCLLATPAGAAQLGAQEFTSGVVEGELLARAETEERAQEIADYYGARLLRFDGQARLAVLEADTALRVRAVEDAAGAPPLYPNYVYELSEWNDPLLGEQYYHAASEIDDEGAWRVTTGAADTLVAVIDTGVNSAHVELAAEGKLSPLAYNAAEGTYGLDAVADDHGHGSHVAGLIAASADNGQGGAGVAPGVSVLPIKANKWLSSTKTYFDTASLVAAVTYAADHGAKVINMSLGSEWTGGPDRLQESAVGYAQGKGALVVCAAGNERSSHAAYPAAYAQTLAVSGLKEGGVFDASYSNFGPEIDLCAPGTKLLSLAPTGNGYIFRSGTSMAAPLVAGAAALVCSRYPGLSPREVRQVLCTSAADKGGPGWDRYYGYGELNTRAALEEAARFAAAETVEVTFETGVREETDGTPAFTVFSPKGSGVGRPHDPVRYGYLFRGWFLDEAYTAPADFSTLAAETPLTLYAKWEQGDFETAENGDGTLTITAYTGQSNRVTIPARIGGVPVSRVGDEVFENMRYLESVTLEGGGAVSLGEGVFAGCYRLKTADLGAGLNEIGPLAFFGCISLANVSLPETLERIGIGAFYSCVSLKTLTLPQSLKELGAEALEECTALTAVAFPPSVQVISYGVLNGCTALETVSFPGAVVIEEGACNDSEALKRVEIPASVVWIGEGAFANGAALKKAVFEGDAPDFGGDPFIGSPETFLICFHQGKRGFGNPLWQPAAGGGTYPTTALAENDPSPYVQSGDYLFDPAAGMIARWSGEDQALTVPAELDGAAVRRIAPYAFSGEGLTEVTIPAAVRAVGEGAFSGCANLTKATFEGDAPEMGSGVFAGAADAFQVVYPQGAAGFGSPLWTPEGTADRYPAAQAGGETQTTGLAAMTVTAQPRLNYRHGDALDLSALRVELVYQDGRPVKETGADGLAAEGISLSIPDGAALDCRTQNGQPVVLACGTVQAQTGPLVVEKALQEPPAAPQKRAATSASVTLDAEEGLEYANGSADGPWQTDGTFTGLAADTEYRFYARRAETDTALASAASAAAQIRTDKKTVSYGGGGGGGSRAAKATATPAATSVESPRPTQPPAETPAPAARLREGEPPYVQGYADGTFRPDQTLTRLELLLMLDRIYELDPAGEAEAFTDVPEEQAALVEKFAAAGVVAGYGGGVFGPDRALTRAELVKILAGLAGETEPREADWPDVQDHWALEYLKRLPDGVVSGYPDGTFRPDQTLTRAEAVTLLNRAVGRTKKSGAPLFSDVPEGFWAAGDIHAAAGERKE